MGRIVSPPSQSDTCIVRGSRMIITAAELNIGQRVGPMMTAYSILLETSDGVRTRQWLSYGSDAEAVADWLPRRAGHSVTIMAEGRVVAQWDARALEGRAA